VELNEMVPSHKGATVTEEQLKELWDRIVNLENHLKARGIDVTQPIPEPTPAPEPHAPLNRQAPVK
jgi:hypothetical protein